MSPLDPNIPLSVRPFKGPDILAAQEAMSRMAQERRLAEQDAFEREKFGIARQQLAEQKAAQQAIGEAFQGATQADEQGQPVLNRGELMRQLAAKGQGHLWPQVSAELDKADQASLNTRKTRAEIARLEREEEDQKNSGLSRLGFAVEQAGNTPEAWTWLTQAAKQNRWATDEDLAPYEQAISQDPAKIASVTAALKSYGVKPSGQKEGDFTLSEGQVRYGPSGQVIAKGPEKSLASERPTRESLAVAAAGGDPIAAAALKTLETGRNPTEATIALEAAGGDAAKAFRMLNAPKPGDERLVQVMGENGVPVWVRESQAVGKPAAQAARAVTGAERQSLAYYNRAKQASEDIQDIEPTIAKASLASQTMLQYAPNVALTKTQQSYRQAQRAFTEARLRKESGAAIPTNEYINDSQTYFAQPGDSPSTIEQKRRARDVVLSGLRFSAGRAYEEYYGEPAPKPSDKPVERVERGPDGKLKLVK